jgi:hypothetical protein
MFSVFSNVVDSCNIFAHVANASHKIACLHVEHRNQAAVKMINTASRVANHTNAMLGQSGGQREVRIWYRIWYK